MLLFNGAFERDCNRISGIANRALDRMLEGLLSLDSLAVVDAEEAAAALDFAKNEGTLLPVDELLDRLLVASLSIEDMRLRANASSSSSSSST